MDKSLSKNLAGPLLVGFAAFLWATDALVRYPAIDKVNPTFIVFIEHVLAVMILLPWILIKHKKRILDLSFKGWLAAFFSGVGGSAFAMVFFTASFLYVNPSVAILLQKLQPIMVVVIAYMMLGERPAKKFYFWGIVAVFAGVVLSFPDFDFSFLNHGFSLHSKGVQYAFAAALLWAASTVAGKLLLERTEPTLAAFWRFFFGFAALGVMMTMANEQVPWHLMTASTSLYPLLYMSLIPGLLAILVYYAGLSRTKASVTTFIELIYPIGAVALNTMFLHTPLNGVQTIAAGVLVLAVAMLSF